MKSRAKQRRGRRGNCYVTCEALYHLFARDQGYVPHTVEHEGDTHWFLARNWTETTYLGHKIGELVQTRHHIIDPTASQFETEPDYTKARGRGFLTKKPSKRARALMEQMLWQGETK